jgi:hypothetical protein
MSLKIGVNNSHPFFLKGLLQSSKEKTGERRLKSLNRSALVGFHFDDSLCGFLRQLLIPEALRASASLL